MNTGRKRFLPSIAAVAAALFALVSLAGCAQLSINTNTEVDKTLTPLLGSGSTLSDGVLTVGINASNTPYGGTNEGSGKTVGLDVDIAAALAEELGMKLQIVDVNSNGKAALSNKQVDIALGNTKSGSDNTVTYSDAYINDGASLYMLEKNVEGATSALKKLKKGDGKVLVQAKTATGLEVQEALGIESVIAYGTLREAFDALENEEAAFLAADAVIGDYLATSYSDIRRVNYLKSDSVKPMYAVTLTDNVELTQAASKALGSIMGNGVLRTITDKWLGKQGEDLLPGKVDIANIPNLLK